MLDLLIRIGHDSYIMVRYVYFFLDSLALSLVALVCIEVLSSCEVVSYDLSMQILSDKGV